jgi:hypothetical protein
MAERTDERTAEDESALDGDLADDAGFDDEELGVDVEALTGEPGDATGSTPDAATDGASAEASSGGLRSRLPSLGLSNPLPGLPSGRDLLVAFGVVVVGTIAGGAIPVVGSLGSVAGVFAGAFAVGLASGKSRYLAFALAGAVSAAVMAVLSSLRFAILADIGLPLAAFGAVTGLLAALLGHYFGRDLRSGLTRDV